MNLNEIEDSSKKYKLKMSNNKNLKKGVFLDCFENQNLFKNVWFDSKHYILGFKNKIKIIQNGLQKKNILSIISSQCPNKHKNIQWIDYFDPPKILNAQENQCCIVPFTRLDIKDECNFASDDIVIYQHPIMCILIKRILWDILKSIDHQQSVHSGDIPPFLEQKCDQSCDQNVEQMFSTFCVCHLDFRSGNWKSVCVVQQPSSEKFKDNIQIEWTDMLCFPLKFLV